MRHAFWLKYNLVESLIARKSAWFSCSLCYLLLLWYSYLIYSTILHIWYFRLILMCFPNLWASCLPSYSCWISLLTNLCRHRCTAIGIIWIHNFLLNHLLYGILASVWLTSTSLTLGMLVLLLFPLNNVPFVSFYLLCQVPSCHCLFDNTLGQCGASLPTT